jgi:hypothetical protein
LVVVREVCIKLGALILALPSVALLGGCDPALGPVIANGTDDVLEITVRFSDRPSEVRLEPHQVYWQLKPARTVESLVITENGQHREVGCAELGALLRQISTPDDALILLRGTAIEVRSISEAKREGFFSKRQ